MDYSNQLSPEVKEKMKKNLVYVGIFAIVMFFAGLTSAYYVSMGGGFWLRYPMPSGFYLSTLMIALSSGSFLLAVHQLKKGSVTNMKMLMVVTFALGVLFVVFQFRGYRQLVERGIYNPSIYWSYPEILVNDGRYGDTLMVYKNNQPITVDGNDFYCNGAKLSQKEMEDFQKFMKQYAIPEQVIFSQQKEPLKAYPDQRYTLYYNSLPLLIKNGVLHKNDSTPLTHLDEIRLCKMAMNVTLGRGHFMIKGSIGKDFDVYLKGNKLDYKDGGFWSKGQRLSHHLRSLVAHHRCPNLLDVYSEKRFNKPLLARKHSLFKAFRNVLAFFRAFMALFIPLFQFYSLNLQKISENGRSFGTT